MIILPVVEGVELARKIEVEQVSVLVVGDLASVARMVGDRLERQGYTVLRGRDGAMALRMVAAQHPDIIILDAFLPERNAFAICEQLKDDRDTCLTPIIMVTDSYEHEERLRAVEAGADDYLRIILDYRELDARIHALLRVKQRIDQFEMVEHVLMALVRAMEAKDPPTGNHLQRLADYALMLGQQLGLRGECLSAVRVGAMLHDIGKIGVPGAILRKRGSLSSAEYQRIKQHPIIGAWMVQPLRLAKQIVPIVRGHHERWDGGGYPDGLAGEAIPLGARIVAVIDAFDAMTSQRPYNQVCSVAEALQRLRAGAGAQWDPTVVAALANCFTLEAHGVEQEQAVGDYALAEP
jgi:putative two-component system response regulator